MLTVRHGRLARLVLVGVLLLPAANAARAGAVCAVSAPALGADVARACVTVRGAVPSWDGRAVVRVIDGDAQVAAETLGRTVSVHRAAWSRLTPTGRQVVLTHELVHVATWPLTTPRTPTWLAEGLADAVALRSSGLPDRMVGRELAAAISHGYLPHALPTDRDFATTAAVAYEESWLAVDLLLRRFGAAAVLRGYVAAGVQPLPEALAPFGGPADLVLALRAEIVRRLS